MKEKEVRQLGRALRRGVALGLVLVAVWGVSLTVDVKGVRERMSTLGEQPLLAVALMQSQLGYRPPEQQAVIGWGRLLLDRSPLLQAGEEPILALRLAQNQEEQPDPEEEHSVDIVDETEEEIHPQPNHQGEEIVEMTAKGKPGGKYLSDGNVYVYNRSKLEVDNAIFTQGTVDVHMGEGPQILIVHSHGTESYAQTDGDNYEESDPYRTTDCTHNVVRVGEEIATVFRAYGFQVIHDTTLFDYPSYNEAYPRSMAAVQQWLEQYPTIQVVLDVHRDAIEGKDGEVYKLVSQEAGEQVAQLMMVVGSDGGGAEHPRWRDNLAFAIALQRNLAKGYSSLARPIVLRNSRYNQHLIPGSLLVEVGGHGNTLSEAIAGARLWADNVARTLLGYK